MLMHLNSLIIAQGHHFAGEGIAVVQGFIFILLLELIVAFAFLAVVWAILKALQKWRLRGEFKALKFLLGKMNLPVNLGSNPGRSTILKFIYYFKHFPRKLLTK